MQPIKTGLCSFGMSGRLFHAPFISNNPGFELYGVAERTKSQAKDNYPQIKTFQSIDSLLADDAIELIIVNTPNRTHFEFAQLALNAGKHVIVEKPFTITSAEAAALIDLADKKDRKLTVYQNRRWDSDFKTVQDVISRQMTGNIIEAEFHFDRFKPGLSAKAHKEEAGSGSGLLYDLGSHLIDQALQLFGRPQALFATARIVRPQSVVEDDILLLLFYKQLQVTLKSCYLIREPVPAYILHGSSGSFLKPRADPQEADLQAGRDPSDTDWGVEPPDGKGLLHSGINGEDTRGFIPSLTGNYMEFFDTLYNAIRHDAHLPVNAGEAADVIRIIELAYQSIQEKKIISFNW